MNSDRQGRQDPGLMMKQLLLIVLTSMIGSAMAVAADSGEFARLFSKCSPGDISVLREGLTSTDSHMMTAPDSPNSALWSALAKVGYLREQPLPPALEPLKQIGAAPLIYSVTPDGQQEIPKLFPQLSK